MRNVRGVEWTPQMERMGIRARNNNINPQLLKGEGKDGEEDGKSSGRGKGAIIANRDRVNCRQFVI